LENQVVREQSKTLSEHYEQFTKFSNSEVQHFRRLEQQRKVAKPDKITRPQYNVWRTREGDQRGVNGSQSKFLIGTWPISWTEPNAPLF
jgi:hypothetical protein